MFLFNPGNLTISEVSPVLNKRRIVRDTNKLMTINMKIIIRYFDQFLSIISESNRDKDAYNNCIFANAKNGCCTYAGLQA